jgi:hypothetical protein
MTIQCACGCGTAISAIGSKGRPQQYERGHNSRVYARPAAIEKACETCGKQIWALPKELAKGRDRFCSKACCQQFKVRPLDNIWNRVDKSGDCWNWTGATQTNFPYGMITHRGRNLRVHRVAYELTYGPIPNGFSVCHSCDNPRCCNPGHLFLGSHADNMADMRVKGRKKRH